MVPPEKPTARINPELQQRISDPDTENLQHGETRDSSRRPSSSNSALGRTGGDCGKRQPVCRTVRPDYSASAVYSRASDVAESWRASGRPYVGKPSRLCSVGALPGRGSRGNTGV